MFNPLDYEFLGLLVVVLSQFAIITMSFQSIKERVKNLEAKVENYTDTHDLIIKLTTKVDLIYSAFTKKHLKK